jgi:signal transduction histidine kinase
MHYSVIQLRSQERVRFRYRLDGFDKNWTDASSRRVAYYTNLPPGHYRFRVAAFEMNNPQQISETWVEIIQRPHFYRTSWFVGCCVVLLGAAVWGAHKFRMRQLHARFDAVLNERNRLAREMHDTLIQGCAGISALLEAHSSMAGAENADRDGLLGCARAQLRTTINEAREAVWDLRHSDGSATTIGPILGAMAQQVSQESGVPVEYHVSGRPFSLDQATAHELLMVVREALHNALRHGQPSRVNVTVEFARNSFAVQVRDNGRGFDAEAASSSPNGHYGLVGMRERVKRVGGQLAIQSRAGAGTDLTFQVPRKSPRSGNGVNWL